MARAFVAKAVYDMPTTRALLDRLDTDVVLRRICGWEWKSEVPSESVFSRAFAVRKRPERGCDRTSRRGGGQARVPLSRASQARRTGTQPTYRPDSR